MTADAWNKLFSDRTWGRYPSEDLVRFVARTFGNGEGKSALEVGCGPGANLWYLAREGFETCGVDLSPVAVEQARKRLLEMGALNADIRIGDFRKLPWPDSSFDLIVDIEALSSGTRDVIDAAVTEIHRVLKPGGWVFSKIFRFDCDDIATPVRIQRVHRDEIEYLYRDYETVSIDWTGRSDGGKTVAEWIVRASRKSPLTSIAD